MDAVRERYLAYIDCLNRRDLSELHRHVIEEVCYNGERVGLVGYREILADNFRDIPDLSFGVALLVCDEHHAAARLQFDCTPSGAFLGLAINGRRVRFAENVIYRWDDGRIAEVWSVIDKAAIEEQVV